LRILKEKLSTGEDAANIKIATPFMIFAATVDEPMVSFISHLHLSVLIS
jgi:hypothetical protein